ncbi:universal stress protein [Phytohabitans sp. ZYX-F-186]|uniref:Universal stress protein n=1 Tax=Phytohabitans maris TaxID=3071409 RepID=A0ABU0ZIS0_9ACTN|nr:universal stress protein [Phytohabitans sp. ZYX-F-186]MDQ7906272.1 universal stress protein [Phytohabitans sp. ZYX-F-186]
MAATVGTPVVVGVDGSEASLAAVDLAVRTAAERHRPLRVLHVFAWSSLDLPPEAGLRADAERLADRAAAYAHGLDPRVTVTSEAVPGTPAEILVQHSREAAVVVLGHRGRGGFASLLVGSVAAQVTAHAASPVVVARGTPRGEGPVVVGVDGSPTSAAAIRFAVEEAAWRKTNVVAVHAWAVPMSTGPADMLPLLYDPDRLAAEQERVLAESVAGLGDDHPDVHLERQLVEDNTAAALIEHSKRAQLVVVGSRGHGGFTGLLLGSVSHALLHHAECPVAVVRPPA